MTAPRILGQDSPAQNPAAPVRGWHYDYKLAIGALANGATSAVLDLQINPGTPFCLRGIGGYTVARNSVTTQMAGAFVEFTDSTDQWLATEQVGTSGDWPTGGNNALYEPVYQQVTYGPNSVIQVRITNSSGADWDSAFLIFRGSHYYYGDRIYSPTYPDCYTSFEYQFPIELNFNPAAANQEFRDLPLTVSGADYVCRAAVLTLISGSMADLEFKLKDQAGRPYSNDYIHHAWLFSSAQAERPGLFYPEIYLPKDRILLVDCQQGEHAAFNVQLSTMGARVFPK